MNDSVESLKSEMTDLRARLEFTGKLGESAAKVALLEQGLARLDQKIGPLESLREKVKIVTGSLVLVGITAAALSSFLWSRVREVTRQLDTAKDQIADNQKMTKATLNAMIDEALARFSQASGEAVRSSISVQGVVMTQGEWMRIHHGEKRDVVWGNADGEDGCIEAAIDTSAHGFRGEGIYYPVVEAESHPPAAFDTIRVTRHSANGFDIVLCGAGEEEENDVSMLSLAKKRKWFVRWIAFGR